MQRQVAAFAFAIGCSSTPSGGVDAPIAQPVVVTTQVCTVVGIVPAQDRLFWADEGCHSSGNNNAPPRGVAQVATSGGTWSYVLESGWGVGAITHDATNLYWLDWADGSERMPAVLGTATLDGGPPSTIRTLSAWAASLDVDSSEIFWSQIVIMGTSARTEIRAMARSGGPERLVSSSAGVPGQLTLDTTDVYWLADGTLFRAPKTGGSSTMVASSVTRFVIDTDRIYIAQNALRSMDKTGGSSMDLLAQGAADFALDATNVYAVTGTDVVRIAKTGGPMATLATLPDNDIGAAIALGANDIFVASVSVVLGDLQSATGRIYRIPR